MRGNLSCFNNFKYVIYICIYIYNSKNYIYVSLIFFHSNEFFPILYISVYLKSMFLFFFAGAFSVKDPGSLIVFMENFWQVHNSLYLSDLCLKIIFSLCLGLRSPHHLSFSTRIQAHCGIFFSRATCSPN